MTDKRGKNIKKIYCNEKTIINTLKNYDIKCFADRKKYWNLVSAQIW